MSAHYGEMQSTASLLRKQVGELSSGIFNFERSGTESADGLKSSLSQQVQELSNQVDDLTRVIQTGGHAYVQLMTRFEESEQTNNDLRKCVADLSSGLIHVEVENKESETAHALALARQKAKADAHVARIEELADVDRVAFSNLVQRLKESEQANLVLRKQVDDLTANVEALKIDKDENAVSAALSLAAQVKELTSQVEDLTEVVQAGGRAYNELCSRLEDSTQTNNLLRKHVGELSSGIVHVEVAGKEAENVHNAEIEELTHLIQTGGRAYLNISSRLEDTQMDNIDLRKQVGELSSGIIRLETDAKTVSADVVETLSKQTQELTDQVADLTRVIQSGGRAFTELSARFEETHDANNQLRRHVGELSSGIVHLEIENSEKETLVSAFEKQVQQLVKQVNGMSHGLHSSNHAYAELATIYEASTQTNNQLRSRIGELTTAIEQLKTESESSKAALAASLGEQISEFSAQVDDLTRLIQSSGRAFMELSGKFADTEETNNELRRQVGELSSGIIHAELDAKDAVSSLKQEFGKQVEELVSQTEDLTRVIQASGHAFNALSGRYEETQEVNTTLRRQVGELSSGIIHLEVDSKASSSENKKLSKQLDAMEQANTHLALVNDKLTKRIGELTQNINHGRSAIEDLSSRYEEAKQSNLTRAERLLTLTSDLERLTTEVNTVHTEYLSLSSKHGASLEENNSLRARAEVLGAQVQELTAKIEAKEKLVADMMKQCIVAVLQGSLVTRRVTELTSTLADKEKEMTEKLGSEREHFEKELGGKRGWLVWWTTSLLA